MRERISRSDDAAEPTAMAVAAGSPVAAMAGTVGRGVGPARRLEGKTFSIPLDLPA
jgi:hypothetical protein